MDDNIKEFSTAEMIASISKTPIDKLEQSMSKLQLLGFVEIDKIKLLADKFAKYKQSIKKAQIKYKENNRELINKIARDYYNRNKTNPEWLKKQSEKSQRSYQKKRATTQLNTI